MLAIRDRAAAIARFIVTFVLGCAILYAIGRYVGWWAVGAIAGAGVGSFAWWLSRLPSRMMPW